MLRRIGYDSAKTNYLSEGFRDGFSIGVTEPLPLGHPRNHSVVSKFPYIVARKLNKELIAGRYAGPFTQLPLPGFI